MDAFTVTFEVEKTTKNTVRYAEVPAPGEPARIGTLYVQAWVLGTPAPAQLTVTVEENAR